MPDGPRSPSLQAAIDVAIQYVNLHGRKNPHVTDEVVDEVRADGTVLIGGEALGTSGVYKGMKAGQKVKVLWDKGKRNVILAHQVRRNIPQGVFPQGGGVVEELFYNSETKEIYLRTADFFDVIATVPDTVSGLSFQLSLPYIEWGKASTIYFMVFGRIVVPVGLQFRVDSLVLIYKLNRTQENGPLPKTPAATLVETVNTTTLATSFGTMTAGGGTGALLLNGSVAWNTVSLLSSFFDPGSGMTTDTYVTTHPTIGTRGLQYFVAPNGDLLAVVSITAGFDGGIVTGINWSNPGSFEDIIDEFGGHSVGDHIPCTAAEWSYAVSGDSDGAYIVQTVTYECAPPDQPPSGTHRATATIHSSLGISLGNIVVNVTRGEVIQNNAVSDSLDSFVNTPAPCTLAGSATFSFSVSAPTGEVGFVTPLSWDFDAITQKSSVRNYAILSRIGPSIALGASCYSTPSTISTLSMTGLTLDTADKMTIATFDLFQGIGGLQGSEKHLLWGGTLDQPHLFLTNFDRHETYDIGDSASSFFGDPMTLREIVCVRSGLLYAPISAELGGLVTDPYNQPFFIIDNKPANQIDSFQDDKTLKIQAKLKDAKTSVEIDLVTAGFNSIGVLQTLNSITLGPKKSSSTAL